MGACVLHRVARNLCSDRYPRSPNPRFPPVVPAATRRDALRLLPANAGIQQWILAAAETLDPGVRRHDEPRRERRSRP